MMPFKRNAVLQTDTAHGPYNSQKRFRWAAVITIVLLLIISVVILIMRGNDHSHSFPQADQEKSTTFQGVGSFINDGLTTDQVNGLIQAFSKYSPKAKNVTIDSSSLYPGPHTPGDGSPFTISFSLLIDSTSYKGIVSYSDISSIRLILLNKAGTQVFDSGVIPT